MGSMPNDLLSKPARLAGNSCRSVGGIGKKWRAQAGTLAFEEWLVDEECREGPDFDAA